MRIKQQRLGALSFCALLLIGAAGCSEPPVEVADSVPSVRVFTVGKKATGQSRRISGKVEAADRSALSFGVSGQVLEVVVEQGQSVVKGQLLARLDSQPLQLKTSDARASLNQARAKLVEAKAKYKRTSDLLDERAASQKEMDAAVSELASADGQVKSTQGALEQAKLDLARTQLKAPFAGKIVSVSIDPFQEVGASSEAMVLQSAGALEVQVLVPETMIRQLDFGQVVQATFPTLEDVAIEGVVSSIGAEAESGNAFPVKVRLNEVTADLRPGMTASVTFNFSAYLDGKTAYLVPLSALAIDAGLQTIAEQGLEARPKDKAPVFVYDAQAKQVRYRAVSVGDLRGNEVEVFDGLKPGDQVVTAGVAFLRDGMDAEIWVPRN